MTFIERTRRNAWLQEVQPNAIGQVETMLSQEERLMLHWFGREMPIEHAIVDGGSFLGGSTLSFATGIERRSKNLPPRQWIHSYDMFRAPRDAYSLGLIKSKKAGDTVLDLFNNTLGQHMAIIKTYVGNILDQQPPNGQIDILFIDVAKSRSIAKHFARLFFPKLIPGRSILIQQDYNDASCPWVNAQMEFFKENFEYLTDQNGGSRVYVCKTMTSDENIDSYLKINLEQEIELQQSAIENSINETTRFWNMVTMGWLVFERDTAAVSIPYMEKLRNKQPWEGASYVDYVIGGMQSHGTQQELEAFYANVFDPHPN